MESEADVKERGYVGHHRFDGFPPFDGNGGGGWNHDPLGIPLWKWFLLLALALYGSIKLGDEVAEWFFSFAKETEDAAD